MTRSKSRSTSAHLSDAETSEHSLEDSEKLTPSSQKRSRGRGRGRGRGRVRSTTTTTIIVLKIHANLDHRKVAHAMFEYLGQLILHEIMSVLIAIDAEDIDNI